MRRAFTLIELMVAIILLGLVLAFLIAALGDLRISSDVLTHVTKKQERATKMLSLLQADILQKVDANITIIEGDAYSVIELRTLSSIYDIDRAYVRWFVDPKNKRLLRSESAYDLIPPYYDEDLYRVHIDEVATRCEWFKVTKANDSQSLLLAMQCGDKKPYILEVLLF